MVEFALIVVSLLLLASLLANLMFYRAIQNQDNVIDFHEELESLNTKVSRALLEAIDGQDPDPKRRNRWRTDPLPGQTSTNRPNITL